jgi:hypothetical protein
MITGRGAWNGTPQAYKPAPRSAAPDLTVADTVKRPGILLEISH